MAALCAKWELISSDESFETYMKAVCVTPEKIDLAKKNLVGGAKVYHDISRNGTAWTIKVMTIAGDKQDVYPEGQAVETLTLDGRKVKVIYTLEGEDLVESQTGEGFTSRNVRRVNGDQMTMTFTANGSVSTSRVYKRVS